MLAILQPMLHNFCYEACVAVFWSTSVWRLKYVTCNIDASHVLVSHCWSMNKLVRMHCSGWVQERSKHVDTWKHIIHKLEATKRNTYICTRKLSTQNSLRNRWCQWQEVSETGATRTTAPCRARSLCRHGLKESISSWRTRRRRRGLELRHEFGRLPVYGGSCRRYGESGVV